MYITGRRAKKLGVARRPWFVTYTRPRSGEVTYSPDFKTRAECDAWIEKHAHDRRPWAEGDEGFEVEWCRELPMLPDDPETFDRDNAKMVTRDFRDLEDARGYARAVYPRCVDGAVQINPFVLERLSDEDRFDVKHNCHKEYVRDVEYYEGEDS